MSYGHELWVLICEICNMSYVNEKWNVNYEKWILNYEL